MSTTRSRSLASRPRSLSRIRRLVSRARIIGSRSSSRKTTMERAVSGGGGRRPVLSPRVRGLVSRVRNIVPRRRRMSTAMDSRRILRMRRRPRRGVKRLTSSLELDRSRCRSCSTCS